MLNVLGLKFPKQLSAQEEQAGSTRIGSQTLWADKGLPFPHSKHHSLHKLHGEGVSKKPIPVGSSGLDQDISRKG